MKKSIILLLLVLFVFGVSGCSKSSASGISVIMNVSTDEIESIDLYANGERSELSKDSEDFVKLLKLIQDNENKSGIIDGGIGIDMSEAQAEDYGEFSQKENARVYVVNFTTKQNVKYNDYTNDSDDITGVFVVPEKNYFGYIIQSPDTGNITYSTFMSEDGNMFVGF